MYRKNAKHSFVSASKMWRFVVFFCFKSFNTLVKTHLADLSVMKVISCSFLILSHKIVRRRIKSKLCHILNRWFVCINIWSRRPWFLSTSLDGLQNQECFFLLMYLLNVFCDHTLDILLEIMKNAHHNFLKADVMFYTSHLLYQQSETQRYSVY